MKIFRLIVLLLIQGSIHGQVADSLTTINVKTQQLQFNWKQLIIPSVLIGYGVIGIESDQIKSFNDEIHEDVKENIDEQFTIDDFSQIVPAASVYALNLAGIKGKNNYRDCTIILSTAFITMSTTVLVLKTITHVPRPDGSSNNSFPSGHTATAFMGAEFLWQEYKDVSVWYGISGYVVAAGTGFFRMYNDRHWLTDVAAGAGIGILSTKFAYWIFPYLNDKVFKSEKRIGYNFITPILSSKQLGICFIKQF